MVSKGRHPKKPIADALADSISPHLTVREIHKAHRWGALVCDQCGEDFSIWSTPRDPDDTAKDIRRFARKHRLRHQEEQR